MIPLSPPPEPPDGAVPTFDEVVTELWPVLPLIHEVVARSIRQATTFFRRRKAAVDPVLHPCLVRYHEKINFRLAGQDVVEDDAEAGASGTFEQHVLSNNGVGLSVGRFDLRILKADDGRVPVAGHSKRKQAFYGQQLSMRIVADDLVIPEPTVNLLVLWTLNGKSQLGELLLACTKTSGATRQSLELHWDPEPIPDAIASLSAPQDTSDTGSELPLRIRKRKTEPK
jgi:hypothetical protein